MRKITVCVLSLAFLAAGMTSCAKSTKGKVTNEWNVISYEKTTDHTNNQGNTISFRLSLNETSFTQQNKSTTNGVVEMDNTVGGTMNAHILNIKKDGTWTWTRDITYVYDNSSTNKLLVETGTWSFVGKSKGEEFEKNERLLFNVLTEKESSSNISEQVIVSEDSVEKTYLTGENIRIYTIVESKRKELQLELDSKIVSDMSSGGVHTDAEDLKITLKAK